MSDRICMLMTIVDRGKGEEVAEFCMENNIYYNFITYGQGTVRSEMLNILGLGTVDKDLVLSLVPKSSVKTHLAGLSGLLKLKRPGKGIALSVPLYALNALVAQCIGEAVSPDESEAEREVSKVAAKFSMILAIVESGYVDQVMEAAKSAGATGGTLLHARGVGGNSGHTFLGDALETEKELVTILAEHAAHIEIMEAINKTCGLLTDAKGIVFSLPVEDIAGIG